MSPPVYTRRLSSTELKTGFIMILKDSLKLFPKVGEKFRLRVKGKEFEASVTKIPCKCRGPDKPHFHWYLDASEFIDLLPPKIKTEVTLFKVKEGVYQLEILKS